jgi:hypothetical protein
MPSILLFEHSLLFLLLVTLGWLLWQQLHQQLLQKWESLKRTVKKRRRWKAKMPQDCPACKSGITLAIRPIRRDVKPWRDCKSRRGRKKGIPTHGHACPNPDCLYFGVTDEQVHALCRRHCCAMLG